MGGPSRKGERSRTLYPGRGLVALFSIEGMMRVLSKKERSKLALGICPFCASKEWLQGPTGGECTNIYCKSCSAGFNIGPGDFAEYIREPYIEVLMERMEAQIWAYRFQAWTLSIIATAELILFVAFVVLHR